MKRFNNNPEFSLSDAIIMIGLLVMLFGVLYMLGATVADAFTASAPVVAFTGHKHSGMLPMHPSRFEHWHRVLMRNFHNGRLEMSTWGGSIFAKHVVLNKDGVEIGYVYYNHSDVTSIYVHKDLIGAHINSGQDH